MSFSDYIKNVDGFEPVQNKAGDIQEYTRKYPLTANEAFSKGQLVKLTNGRITGAADTDKDIVGVITRDIAVTENTAASEIWEPIIVNLDLVLFRVNFSNYIDFTALGGTTTTITATSGDIAAADDQVNGAMLYCYEGKLKGQKRIINDYDFETTAVTDTITVLKPFSSAPDTGCKFIITGDSDSASPLYVGKRGAQVDSDGLNIDCSKTTNSEEGQLLIEDELIHIGQFIVKIFKNNEAYDA